MLYLAQVQKKESSGGVALRLLAHQKSEHHWVLINPEEVPLTLTHSVPEASLVLAELAENQEVLSIKHAKDWVLDLVREYLSFGMSPTFLEEEVKRTEKWRQDLTLQSQDLTRLRTEMEARREQIQTLEEDLKQKKQQLELMAEELNSQTDGEISES
ncbi:hypothetical protein [Lyngbya aestuarii]|uniref:hypothetical protein n=1 Tax=Lyngbya aestuarii TaxID=118322 RepID=UPI00403D82C7